MVQLVQQITRLVKRRASARTQQQRIAVSRQAALTQRQIDMLVYELYGLSEAEIIAVEGGQIVAVAAAGDSSSSE
jgi:hypothetical protein